MVAEGAHIIDVGGESTRPGAEVVSALEEQRRVLPVIEALAGRDCVLSVDTYRAETAQLAIKAGAHIVNDVWGAQKEPDIARIAADSGAGICLMHTGRERTPLADQIADQFQFLELSLEIVEEAGLVAEQIVLDPGFGFGKDARDNLVLLHRLEELSAFDYPLLIGTSRKRFIQAIAGENQLHRDVADVSDKCCRAVERGERL